MESKTIKINNTDLPVKEYKGQRVVTFKEIDAVHERPAGTARKRFNDNKKHFVEEIDFFRTKCSEVRPFFGQTPPNGFNPNADIILVTESGYLMLVKSFTDDLAWIVQRQLVNVYFRSNIEQRQDAARQTLLEIPKDYPSALAPLRTHSRKSWRWKPRSRRMRLLWHLQRMPVNRRVLYRLETLRKYCMIGATVKSVRNVFSNGCGTRKF